ncbi:MAG: hypothetical protein LUH03_05885 [Oscillospiraceae bacterium]|nr:hypothetical protein [Oscillospiraceae bacterium]
MRNTMLTYIDRFMHDRHSRKVLGSVLLVLAIVVSLTVYWQLRLHGIAITNETYCGYEEHVHTEECYETTLICELEETVGLTSDWHAHDESCYDEEGNLVCELEECEPHTHTDECYETTLICEIPEHTHTSDCLVDLEADVEDATVWEATLPELSGDLRTDIINIAYSQIGYTESTANYTLADDGTTKMGYTRYGAWYGGLYYGSEYSDWDSLFVAFCLDYAGIAEDFTYNSGAYAWSVDLTTIGYYQTTDTYSTSTGDVAFIDTDADGRANITAIVVTVDESAQTITVIQGNYTVTDSEGNSTDTVAVVTYSTATEIATQNEIVALSAGSETEITPVVLGYANVTYVTVTYVPETEEETEEVTEEVAEEVIVDETEADETETEEADETEETEEETVLLTTASAVLTYDEYCSEAYSLYTYAMSVTDSTEAAPAWDSLITLWNEIDAAYAEGTLTESEWLSLDALMTTYSTEVYSYFTESVGYDPYEVMTADGETNATSSGNATMYYYTSETDTATASDSTASWTYTNNASYSDGELTVGLRLDFSADRDSLNSNTTYYIDLPEDIVVPESALSGTHEGTNDDGKVAFTYQYIDNGDGTYSIAITYLASYLNSITDDPVACYIDYKSYIFDYDEDDLGTDGVKITFEDGSYVTITYEEISSDDNESLYQDLTISKNATYYNASTNSITYTVTISSLTGTGVITLKDALSIVNNNSSLYSTADIKSIDVTGVQYQIYTLSYTYDNNGTTYYVYEWKNSGSTTETNGEITTSTATGTYSYTTDTSTDSLSVTLSPLTGATDDYTSDRYVITYTVTFDDSYSFDSKVTNDAEASSTITTNGVTDTVTDEAAVSRTVSSSMIDKTGSYSSETGLITYTIIFNDGGNDGGIDIAGYVLTDTALIGIDEDDVTVYYLDGTSYEKADSSEYTIDTTTGTITFSDSSNTKTYKIVYTVQAEPSGFTSSTSVYNEVTVKTGDTTVDKDYTTVNVYSNGTVDKELDEAYDYTSTTDGDTTTYTRVLDWTSTITVPTTGIAAGTVISDYLGTWSGDTSSYTYGTSSTHQWFTYEQLVDTNGFFTDLVTNGITIDSVNYTNGTDFTLEAYDIACGKWLTYSELTSGDHDSCLFTAYKITLNTAITEAGTITLSYSTTADITDVMGGTTKRDYYNYISVGSKSDTANYTEYDTVYKTNAYGVSSDTNVTATTNNDGTVTWIVNVLIPEKADNNESFVITDTLPAGVTLETLKINIGSETVTFVQDASDSTKYTATMSNNTEVTATVTKETTGDVVTITVPYNAYSSMVAKTGAYIAVTYTCSIDTWSTWYDSTAIAGTTTNTYKLENSVKVTWGSTTQTDYGSDTQTQTIEVTYVEEAEETDHDVVEKNVDASGISGTVTNILKYSVILNLDKQDLLKDGDYLEFVDTLEYYNDSEMTLNLMTNTVTFYELIKLELVKNDSDEVIYYHCTYTDSDGNTQPYVITASDLATLLESTTQTTVYKYPESDGSYTYYYMLPLDITWNFSTGYDWRTLYYITATVPDKTAILVTYSYYIADATTATGKLSIKNSATLTGTTTSSDADEVNGTYTKTELTAGVYSSGGYTLIKSGTSTSYFLPDAVFQLYVYDNDASSGTHGTFVPAEYTETEISTYNLANGVDYIVDGNHYYAIYTTNSYGTITVSPYAVYDVSNPTYWNWYKEDLLYYLVEIEAPEGYILDGDTKYYFYWQSTNNTTGDISGLTSDITAQNISEDSSTQFVSNLPITTFTLTKVSSSDSSAKLAGAEFYLYEYAGTQYNYSTYQNEEIWNYLGTYTTDENGEISITYDSDVYSFDTAYMLKEVSAPDGYSAGYNDNITFYFYWDEDETSGTGIYPSNWGTGTDDDGTTYATAANLASGDVTVYATNTKTNTSVSVTKVWLDSTGKELSDAEKANYTATVQLYYYLSTEKPSSSSTSSGDYETVTLYTTGTVSASLASYASPYDSSSLDMQSTGVTNMKNALLSGNSSYIQMTISADSISNLGFYLQNSSNSVIASLTSPSSYSYDNGTYTVTYSYSDIVKALGTNSISGINSFYINNGGSGTITSFSVLSDLSVADSASKSQTLSGNWASFDSTVLKSSTDAEYLQTSGAYIRVTYSVSELDASESDHQIQVGIQQYKDGTASAVYAYSNISSTTNGTAELLIPLSSFVLTSFEWSYYNGIATNSSGLTGEITKVEILVPYDSSSSGSSTTTSTDTLVEISVTGTLYSSEESTADYANVLADTYTTGKNNWSDIYQALLANDDAYLEVIIDGSSSANLVIQYTNTTWGDFTQMSTVSGTYTLDDNGYYVYKFTASDILDAIEAELTGDYAEYFAYKIFLTNIGADSATLISAAVKVDNEVSTSGTTVDGNYDVTLYTWTPSNNDQVENSSLVELKANSSWQTDNYWNVISTWEEDEANIRALLDAIYANLESNVYITVTPGYGTTADNLSNLQLIIQGDTSVGSDGYGTILSIKPTEDPVKNSDGTYTLIYSSEDIRAGLFGAESKYQDAASVYADYLKLILCFTDNQGETATLNSIEVVTTDELSLSSTYSESLLLGETTYTGEPYGGKYTLEEDNNWTETVTALPISYTDDNNVTWYYYYYFVETSVSDSDGELDSKMYTTTYSQTEGENTGGEIVITNVIAETTEVTVEKKWVDGNGNDVSADYSGASINVDLYYYLAPVNDSGTTSGTDVVTIYRLAQSGATINETYYSQDTAISYATYEIPDGAVSYSISVINPDSPNASIQIHHLGTNYMPDDWDDDSSYNKNPRTVTISDSETDDYGYYNNSTTEYTVTVTFYDLSGKEVTASNNANAVALSASTSGASIATLLASIEAQTPTVTAMLANSTDTVTLYFTPNGGLWSGSDTTANVPAGVKVSVNVELSGTSGWVAIYKYDSNDRQTTVYSCQDGTSLIDTSFETEADYYYLVQYSGVSCTKITLKYTDSEGVNYTLTCATNSEGGYSWTTPTSGGETGGGTGGEEDDPGTSTEVTYSRDQLIDKTDTTGIEFVYYDSYTITYDSETGTWSYTVDGLPAYITIGNVTYAYYYYFVEKGTTVSKVLPEDALYSTDTGVTSGTITITNTVSETSTVTTLPESYSVDYTTMYEFGAMLILLSLVGAGASTKTCRNISRTRKSLVEEPHRDGVDPGGTHERLPDVRNRKFVIPRIVRKGDTRAGPEDDG